MIKIAVCDDNSYELEEVAEKIKNYLDQQETALQTVVQTFQCGEYLIMEIESGHPADIFILDVDMPGMNGFELTEEIRKRIPAPIIIFLTSHIEYGSKACKNRAFRYIYKLNIDEELYEALDSGFLELRHIEERSITVTHYNEYYRIPYSNIKYIRRGGRQLSIETLASASIFDNRGVKEFLEALNDSRFVLIDRGCILNVDFAKQITGTEVILTTNERLAISRRMLKNLKLALIREWNI